MYFPSLCILHENKQLTHMDDDYVFLKTKCSSKDITYINIKLNNYSCLSNNKLTHYSVIF
jgi:hypothetical protein